MMKKCLRVVAGVFLCIAILLPQITCMAVSADQNVISAGKIIAKPGDTIEIPVSITGNTGLMGFSVLFSFDAEQMSPISVARGAILSSGLFDDSIGTGDTADFKVIWSGTENVIADGELFVITFKVSDTAAESCTINVSSDLKDTFNEKWEKVPLNCEDIVVQVEVSSPEPISLLDRIRCFFKKIADFFKKLWILIVGLFK